MIGTGHDVIYHAINAGQLRSVKIGARRVISRRALLSFIGEGDAPDAA